MTQEIEAMFRIEHPVEFKKDLENYKKQWKIHDLIKNGYTFSVTTNDESFIHEISDECKTITEKRLVVIDQENINRDLQIIFNDYRQSKIFPPLNILKLYQIISMFKEKTYHNYLKVTTNLGISYYGVWSTEKRHVDNIEYLLQKLRSELKIKPKKKVNRRPLPKGIRHEVFVRDNFTCVECGKSKNDGVILHVDHLISVSKGGTDEMKNLRTLCDSCNLEKNDLIHEGDK